MRRPLLPLALLAAAIAAASPLAAREVTGHLAYAMKVALPPSAMVAVELAGPAGPIAERREGARGAQVPLPFLLDDPDNAADTLRAAVFIEGRAVWTSGPVLLPQGEDDLDLGTVRLDPFLGLGFANRLDCGDQGVDLAFVGDRIRLRAGGEVHELAEKPAMQGRRFTDGATPETALRLLPDRTDITLTGRKLPRCTARIPQSLLPLRASGTEPDWSLSLSPEGLRFETPDAAPIVRPLPPAASGETVTFTDAVIEVALTDRPCRNAMTGLPHPVTVAVKTGGRSLTGCGGDPAALLEGAWQVAEIGGKPPRGGAKLLFTLGKGRISGSACNRFNGRFTLSGEGLSFGPLAATRRACPQAGMAAEAALFAALSATTGFGIDEAGQLVLTGPGGPLLSARR